MKTSKTFSIAMLFCIAAACLLPTAIGEFTISPQTKGWALSDITDESYTIMVADTGIGSTVQVTATLETFQYIENVTVFRPVPPELLQYITITPDMLNLGKGDSGNFTVHVAFPDLAEMYGHTWETRILINDTNKYNFADLGPDGTQKIAIIRLYLPLTKPIKPIETPFYVYPFMIVIALIFLGGVVMYLRKRSVPIALRDHESKGSEWAGMEVLDIPTHKLKPGETPVIAEAVIPPEVRAFVEDTLRNELPQRKPVLINPIARNPVQTVDDPERERKDRENARKRDRRRMQKEQSGSQKSYKKIVMPEPVRKPVKADI